MLLTLLLLALLNTVFSWATYTHRTISGQVLNLLYTDSNGVYSKMRNWFQTREFLTGTMDPDWVNKAFGTHHYIYDGKKNVGQYYKHAPICFSRDNARTLLEKFYANAKDSYNIGDYTQASLWLGRSVHMIQDISCTAHSAPVQLQALIKGKHNKTHTLYERNCDHFINNFHDFSQTAKYEIAKISKIPFGVFLNDIAIRSSALKKQVLSRKIDQHEEAFNYTVNIALKNSVALIMKFYMEITGKSLADLGIEDTEDDSNEAIRSMFNPEGLG